MKEKIPRLRIFAGPNGSRKSTITSVISQELLGIYINPDDMEREIRENRSLDLLHIAVQNTNRSYIFDNSSHEHIWIAEITNGQILEMKVNQMPQWFKTGLWDKFNVRVDLPA